MDRLGSAEIFHFQGFRFDGTDRCLYRLDGSEGHTEPVSLGARALALLAFLVESEGRLLSKDEIMHAVWPAVAVEESNLTVQISTLRRILDRGEERGSCIQTIPGRGYRFVSAVTRTAPPSTLGNSTSPTLPLPEKPSIAVLPFANMSGDPNQEYFADGMVEDIIIALSRIRWLCVLSRNSSFTYKGQTVDVKQVGRDLGVRYVLEGSVRKYDNRVRITAQLIDAVGGAHLWADRFDGLLEDVFELQDKVAASVAGVIEPALLVAETSRSTTRPTADLTAYDLYLRGNAMGGNPMVVSSAVQIPEALSQLEEAIARDPRYGPALGLAAVCCARLVIDGRSGDPAADRRKGIDFARRALEAAGDDPHVLVYAAYALASLGEDIVAMMALADRALTLNPTYAGGWSYSGVIRLYAGQPDIAMEQFETALRLSPRAETATMLHQIGTAHFFGRRFDQAAPSLLLSIQMDPSHTRPYRALAACYAHMGRLDDAKEIVTRLRAMTSLVIPDFSPYRNPEHRELLLSGLRLATGETAQHSPEAPPQPAPAKKSRNAR